jgi:glyoxylase-like metal-dependent hydrolase (beta-lactamase superfamily II)
MKPTTSGGTLRHRNTALKPRESASSPDREPSPARSGHEGTRALEFTLPPTCIGTRCEPRTRRRSKAASARPAARGPAAASSIARRNLFLLALCLFISSAVAQQDFSKVEIKVTKVAGTVYMLEGAGGNIGVCAGDDGIVIVDDQFAPLARKIKEALKGISDKPVKFVINTHFHGDHAGGNAEFSGSATIVAHENVRKRLKEGGKVGGNEVKPAAKEALPIVTFNDRASIHVNGEEIRAIHFPHGHTDGDSVIFFQQANVIHMGDDFVTYGFPFVDTHSGGSVSGMIAGVEKVLGMVSPDVKIIPGHGPLSTLADLRKYLEMLKATRGLVAEAVKERKTVQQMKEEHLMAKYPELGKGFIKADGWIEVLYADVTKQPAAE